MYKDHEALRPEHDCGLCDAPIRFAGREGGYPSWVCTAPDCDWWHTSKDCCHGYVVADEGSAS